MKLIVGDTDILSTFGKVGKIALLRKLFGNLIVPPSVHHELIRAKSVGYDFVESILENVEVIPLTSEEFEDFKDILEKEGTLHEGEIQGMIICKKRDGIFCTNDYAAKRYCRKNGIEFIDLEDILFALVKKGIVSKKELKELIEKIEQKDRTLIKAKEKMFLK